MPALPPADILSASVSDVRPLASMLRSLSFRPKAIVEVQAHGMRLTVEEGRSIQANAYINASAFDSYSFTLEPPDRNTPSPSHSQQDEDEEDNSPFVVFGVSLSTILECLNIFGNANPIGEREWSGKGEGGGGGGRFGKRGGDNGETPKEREEKDRKSTSLRLSYAGQGEPLVLLLEEGGIVTRCDITTYEPDALMDISFDDDARVQKLIMKSEWLRDALTELDPSSEKVTFMFSPGDNEATPYNRYPGARKKRRADAGSEDEDEDDEMGGVGPTFRLESVGTLGSTEMDYPNDDQVLETFECVQPIRNSYKFTHVQLTTKALVASTKTSIRTDDQGLMSFQFMIPLGTRGKQSEGKSGFVEFLCVALDEDY